MYYFNICIVLEQLILLASQCNNLLMAGMLLMFAASANAQATYEAADGTS